jgi:rhodanese-related sulfurtransferase
MPDEAEGLLFPGAVLLNGAEVSAWGKDYAGRDVVVVCRNGQAVSPALPHGFAITALTPRS